MIYIKEPNKGQQVTISHKLGIATYLVDGEKIKSIDDCMSEFKKWVGLNTLYLHQVYVQVY